MTRPERINVVHVTIDVNREKHLHIEIQNIGHPAGGLLSESKYRWEASGPGLEASGTLNHDRDHGAMSLVHLVLDEVALWMPQPVT